jgi:hypothetical protein
MLLFENCSIFVRIIIEFGLVIVEKGYLNWINSKSTIVELSKWAGPNCPIFPGLGP